MDRLRRVLPPESRIVNTADHADSAHIIADVIRGGEPCVLGCGDAHDSLVVLVTTLRSLGSIRHVAVLEHPSSTHDAVLIPTLTSDQAHAIIAKLSETAPVVPATLELVVDARTSHLMHASGGAFPW